MNDRHYQQARLARDHRFDGRFFVAVKTTGIYCRPICPAPAPKEQNVCYFETAIAAANAGFRPCLRCRPDSAPSSWAWKGTDTTLERALRRPTGKQTKEPGIRLFLSYRPPYDWAALRTFLQTRLIDTLEWCCENHYGRTFRLANGAAGRFTAWHRPERCGFEVTLEFNQPSAPLPVVRTIRRLLDLDADSSTIDAHLAPMQNQSGTERPGLRLPGTWDAFEAGIRAILGQQISVMAARNLVRQIVAEHGELLPGPDAEHRLFPTPAALAHSDLSTLKIPGRRRQTLIDLARFFVTQPDLAADPEQWLALSGIGPWTVNYARMRGLGESDVWLGSDLGVKKALGQTNGSWEPADASPWQSYLTFYMWSLL